ncbi:ABC transporter permease [Thermoflavifilum thermophilum]|uniref:Transport permease protein n=1 Tax=Thermoflavifilum thermophilum TaxID=1393122 RepID=A0A1I7NBM8_9BACT|nr:ABC transporter permease [Thermoflavifilum thermophilum]SFV32069.1 lipopolysaccharide transport system permease protein [Thermoflavifilum thermophilum]
MPTHWEISAKQRWWGFPEMPRLRRGYRDLLWRLVRRDLLTSYQQTILGPLWLLLQPLLSIAAYTFIFKRVADLPTDGLPAPLFYLTGIIGWTFFSESLIAVSYAYHSYADIFSKVYFPRIIVPLAALLHHGIRAGIQSLLLIGLMGFYLLHGELHLGWKLLLALPVIILIALLSLGLGLIAAAISARYRDIQNLLHFLLRLGWILTPIIYPLSMVHSWLRRWLLLNPMSALMEYLRYALLGAGYHQIGGMLYAALACLVVCAIGLMAFRWRDGKVMDII